jgi:DNA helicase-2/ATP-dependent DNA helicase PcrA
MAIFYRVNALSRVMEDALRRMNIPYQIARGVEFYNRKEIKDVLGYLRVIANPQDEVSLSRIANVPARGLSDKTIRQLQTHALGGAVSLLEAMAAPEQLQALTPRAVNSARNFVTLMNSWREMVYGAGSNSAAPDKGRVQSIMEDVVRRSGLEAYYKKIGEKEQSEISNIEELINSASEYDRDNPQGSLEHYLGIVSLVSDVDRLKDSGGAVTLMTLHAAKGLEFPVVSIIGLEEGILPHSRAWGSDDELEEERRLCFVGITRAQERLLLSHAASRMIRGIEGGTSVSKFLREMPEESLELIDHSAGGFDLAATSPPDHQDEQTQHPGGTFRRGQMVRHRTFGIGCIAAMSTIGQHTRVVVEFDRAGRKTLILQYAKLEPVG